MATKAQVYATLADDTARKITGDYLDWAAFLDTSSRLYKYPFHDQLLIYAQRPDATACAEYDIWNYDATLYPAWLQGHRAALSWAWWHVCPVCL